MNVDSVKYKSEEAFAISDATVEEKDSKYQISRATFYVEGDSLSRIVVVLSLGSIRGPRTLSRHPKFGWDIPWHPWIRTLITECGYTREAEER